MYFIPGAHCKAKWQQKAKIRSFDLCFPFLIEFLLCLFSLFKAKTVGLWLALVFLFSFEFVFFIFFSHGVMFVDRRLYVDYQLAAGPWQFSYS